MRWKTGITVTASVAALALFLVGCEVAPSDVEAAREKVRDERIETQQARSSGAIEVREKEQREKELRETAMTRPNDDTAQKELGDAEKATAKAAEKMKENVENEKRETVEAQKEAERLAAELKATEARTAYVATIDLELVTIDGRLESMRDRLAKLEGAEQEKLSAEIEVLKIRRESVAVALSNLKSEEVMTWESKKPAVEEALIEAKKDV